MKTLYRFNFDDKDGIITRYEISEYEVSPDTGRGRCFKYYSDAFTKTRRHFMTYENDFDKVFFGKMHTFNPSVKYAADIYEAWIAERKKAACEKAEKLSELYDSLHKKYKF
jgi:hypothetical protein